MKTRTEEIKKIEFVKLEKRKEEISKVKELSHIIKQLGKEDHQRNIEKFQKFNEVEKEKINNYI